MQGTLTPETTLPQLKQFLNDGGTIITVGSRDEPRLRAESADRESPVGARAGSGRSRAGRRGVLRAGLDPSRRGRQHCAGCGGHAGAARRVLRQQPGVPTQAGCGREGREGRRVVRQRRRRCAAVGRGDRTISRAARPFSSRTTARARSTCSGRRSRSAVSRTGRSSSCSTASTRRRTSDAADRSVEGMGDGG